jgi:hypothetical protein
MDEINPGWSAEVRKSQGQRIDNVRRSFPNLLSLYPNSSPSVVINNRKGLLRRRGSLPLHANITPLPNSTAVQCPKLLHWESACRGSIPKIDTGSRN